MRNGLTQKQETFCLKYFELGNATEAALIAGYSPRSIRNIASVNLTKANITERLEELRKKVEDASVANRLEREQILTEIARGKLADFVTVGADGAWFDIDGAKLNSRAIAGVTSKTVLGKDGADDAVFVRVNLHDPTKAIDLLNKMDKLYSENPPPSGEIIQNFIFVLPDGVRLSPRQLISGQLDAENPP